MFPPMCLKIYLCAQANKNRKTSFEQFLVLVVFTTAVKTAMFFYLLFLGCFFRILYNV